MGDKFIIELEDKPFHKDGDFLCRVKGFNSLVFDMTGIGMLTPYTEPDLEQVRKEAYENGYENGFIAGHLKAEKSGQSFYEDGYQRGLNDAWDTARKIWEYDTTTLREIFGEGIMRMDWFMKFTASEAIEKLKAYKQEEQIQVGDEVATKSGINGICTNVSNLEIGEISLVFNDGSCGVHKLRNIEGKTGRHFPEIAEVLAKMKETNNG